MKVLLYLLVPALIVAAWSTAMWLRNRKPTSLQSGVDSFQREMKALSPEGPEPRRRPGRPAGPPPNRRADPRRPER